MLKKKNLKHCYFKANKANFSLKSKANKEPSEYISKTNIYIKGLNENTTDDDLLNLCSKYETILQTNEPILKS